MQIIDMHTHSAYSGHGEGSVAQVVERALEIGLSTLAQTEHLVLPDGMDPLFETSMSMATMQSYLAELRQLREELRERNSPLELVIGIEADWLDGRTRELEQLCDPFEYVLGSVHFLDRRPIDDSRDLSVWDDYGHDGVWKRYFETWLDMASAPGPITCFAHPDLPKKYGWRPSFDVRDYYLEMAHAAARSGRMVEVNTAGLKKEAGEAYPCAELLREFCCAGVDCTVGSDAHRPQDVGFGIERAYARMREAGYTKVAVAKADGDRRYIAL